MKSATVTKKAGSYTEADISYFETELLKLRAKPQMYIGPTDDAGIFTILREAMDNSVDEARAGRNKLVHAFVTDQDFWVVDEGIGIPVKKHPGAKISTLTHVLTALQASGKMKGDAYTAAIGTHGVGIKATNALSKSFEVWTYRSDAGGWHYTKFQAGAEKVKVGKSKAPKLPDGRTPTLGTVIRFAPDPAIFGKAKLQMQQLLTWCEITAYMNAGLRIRLTNAKNKTKTWYSKTGISEYLSLRMTALKATPLSKKPLSHQSPTMDLALHFADVEGCEVEFFTNTIRNVDLGFHADAFFKALVDSLKPYKGRLEYTPTDLKDGLVGVLNYKINAPQFSSQTKEKLVDVRMKVPAYEECLKVLSAFWSANKTLAKDVSQRAAALRAKTQEFLKDKRLIKSIKKAGKTIAVKLADVDGGSKVPLAERELYIVEGDSAGGTAIKARIKDRQAVWPIRGKILNVMQSKKEKVVVNAEIAGIFAALGIDLGKKDPLSALRYGRVILMADPDVDGSHINTLLATLFWMYTPDLVKSGKIHVLLAPEFLARHKGRTFFGMTKEALYKVCGSDKVIAQHIKGWGEISDTDLYHAGMSLESRRLARLTPPSKEGARKFALLMEEDTAYRKHLLGIKL